MGFGLSNRKKIATDFTIPRFEPDQLTCIDFNPDCVVIKMLRNSTKKLALV